MTTTSNEVKLTGEELAKELGISDKEFDRLQTSVVSCIADQLVADGVIIPTGRSKRQVAEKVSKFLLKALDNGTEFWPFPRHDTHILKLAKTFRAKGDLWESCLFYATWFEHRVNFIITRDRTGLAENEKQQMVREVSLLGKYTWLLTILGFRRLSPSVLKVIRQVVEVRNAFVHFKFKLTDPDLTADESKRLRSLLNKVEKAVHYIENYEAKHLYGGIKGFFPRALKPNHTPKSGQVKSKQG